jgi:hypothetical protein
VTWPPLAPALGCVPVVVLGWVAAIAAAVPPPTITTASATAPITFRADQCGRISTWVGTSTCRAPGGNGVPQVRGSRCVGCSACGVGFSVLTVAILLLVLTPADSLLHEPVREL